jgi:hypothetical protein
MMSEELLPWLDGQRLDQPLHHHLPHFLARDLGTTESGGRMGTTETMGTYYGRNLQLCITACPA